MFDSAKSPISRYDNYGNHVVLNRGSDHGVETDDSGESTTPPLWRTSPNRPLLRPNQYRDFSPEAKTQAILKGQMELMEMVARMPESSYELSLKDLVECPMRQDNFMEEQRVNIDHEITTRRREHEVLRRRKKNNENKLQMMKRNGSIENRGLLLNMNFPVSSWGSGKKKENLNSTDSKVLPKPGVAEGVGEKEWWKKRYVVSAGESESVGLSSNSGSSKSSGSSSSSSSSRRRSRHEGGGCWALIFTKQGKMAD